MSAKTDMQRELAESAKGIGSQLTEERAGRLRLLIALAGVPAVEAELLEIGRAALASTASLLRRRAPNLLDNFGQCALGTRAIIIAATELDSQEPEGS